MRLLSHRMKRSWPTPLGSKSVRSIESIDFPAFPGAPTRGPHLEAGLRHFPAPSRQGISGFNHHMWSIEAGDADLDSPPPEAA